MQFIETQISGVKIVVPSLFSDDRGYFYESFRGDIMDINGIPPSFIQDNQARSEYKVIRGLHYQLKYPQGKLVSVTVGKVLDVAVDIRRGSPTFGDHISTILSDKNHKMMFIPEGFAHGYSVLSDTAIFQYKCTNIYHKEDQYGVRWDDPELKIDWQNSNPILSQKDLNLPYLKKIKESHLPLYES